LDVIASDERLMPHLHLSLQAGDDMILKRMKRRHLRRDAIDFCAQVRRLRPDMAFGADLIAGFPTETEEMFARSLSLVKECGLTFLHVFPYSPRPGTPAAKMPQVDGHTVKQRARRLRQAGEAALRKRAEAEIGARRQVLIESATQGRTEHFMPVEIAGYPVGTMQSLVIARPGCAADLFQPTGRSGPGSGSVFRLFATRHSALGYGDQPSTDVMSHSATVTVTNDSSVATSSAAAQKPSK